MKYEWYHTIDLGNGQATPGVFDLRDKLHNYKFPKDMTGMRVLDVGTASGFFAFEFEKRGADVLAIDIPTWESQDFLDAVKKDLAKYPENDIQEINNHLKNQFETAKTALGSKVKRLERTIYELDPEELGIFDVVFCGSMLMHVRDPMLAIQKLFNVTKKKCIVATSGLEPTIQAPVAFFVGEPDQCNWWRLTPACLTQMLTIVGFKTVKQLPSFYVNKDQHIIAHAYR